MLTIVGTLTVILSMWNQDRLQLTEAEKVLHGGILSDARKQYTEMDRNAALAIIKPILHSKHVGPEAQLLYAGILIDNRRSDEAVVVLEKLVNEPPEIAGTAYTLLARILLESESPSADKLKEIEEHRKRAEELLPETAEAYFLRAMTAVTVKEQLACLDRALQLDPGHYESRRLRAFTYYASRKYEKMKDDALGMTILRPRDPLGYSLRAIAWRELGHYPEAIADYDSAIALTTKGSSEYSDFSTQRCETLLWMGDYERAIAEAQKCLELSASSPVFQYHIFCALTALGDYDKADAVFRQIIASGYEARQQFQSWCMKYVFDTLEGGRPWHPPDREPVGAAFLAMLEAEETYRGLSAKARRVTTDGFSAQWSPDGTKLAFSMGVYGYSGVATFEPVTKETELLIVPGKDPRWSPDGKHIAFVRDCRFLRVSEFVAAERKNQPRLLLDEEVWVMNADGTEARRLARGGCPSWSKDSTCIYYHSHLDKELCSVSIEGPNVKPKRIMECSSSFPSVSPDNQRVAYRVGRFLKVIDLDSQAPVAEWPVPFKTWSAPRWSPTGDELCMGGSRVKDRDGLWIYHFDSNEPVKVLDCQKMAASWAPDGTKLAFRLGPPYFEIWSADLNPKISTIEALGPGQTLDEHWHQMLRLYTRRMQADPQDASAYYERARYYDYLRDREKADVDMRRWSDILSGGSSSDLQVAAPPAYGDFIFGEQVNLKEVIPVIDPVYESIDCLSYDGLEIYIESFQPGGSGYVDLWRLRRDSVDEDWGSPENLGPEVNTENNDATACISADGLTLYFNSNRPGGHGKADIYITTRATRGQPWGEAVNIGQLINSPDEDAFPWIVTDGLELYFDSTRPGGYGRKDIWVAKRATENDPWGEPENLGSNINSPSYDGLTCISADGLWLFFHSERPGGYGSADIWMTRRASLSEPWQIPINLGSSVNSPVYESLPRISPDGSTLYFITNSGGIWDNWQAPITYVSQSSRKDSDANIDQKLEESKERR
jgi:Tol biopolymer transport system component/tetratricopeptide (TPR) repeat protein